MSKNQKPGTGVSNKRRRELASAKYERQSARRAERAARKRRNERIGWTVAALVGVAVIAGVLWWTTSPSDDLATPGTSASPSASPSTASPCTSGVRIRSEEMARSKPSINGSFVSCRSRL